MYCHCKRSSLWMFQSKILWAEHEWLFLILCTSSRIWSTTICTSFYLHVLVSCFYSEHWFLARKNLFQFLQRFSWRSWSTTAPVVSLDKRGNVCKMSACVCDVPYMCCWCAVSESGKGLAAVWFKFFLDAGVPPSDAGSYAVTFTENRIQSDMMSELTKEYLADMGITVLGDVIAILKHARIEHAKVW